MATEQYIVTIEKASVQKVAKFFDLIDGIHKYEHIAEVKICHCKLGGKWKLLHEIIPCEPLNFCSNCGGKLSNTVKNAPPHGKNSQIDLIG